MNKIKLKLKQIKESNTQDCSEVAIKYLLSIIKGLLEHQRTEQNNMDDEESSVYERKSYSEGKKSKFVSVFAQCRQSDSNDQEISDFKGSQVSEVQKVIKNLNQKKIQHKKSDQLNLRGLQKTIQIYHQCLWKTLEIVMTQHEKLMNKLYIKSQCNEKFQQYWQKYLKAKQSCKKFNDLVTLAQNNLARQFMKYIKPFKQALQPKQTDFYNKQYILVNY